MGFFSLFFLLPLNAQIDLRATPLDEQLHELSGLVYVDKNLIGHNDSEGAAEVYFLNSENGEVERSVRIEGAVNIDWEDLASDDQYLWIADLGNNSGSRRDLKIYRVALVDLFGGAASVAAEVIEVAYADQDDFSSSPNANDFDAEALVSFGNHLYIFTKNWLSEDSRVYKVPKQPGTYSLEPMTTLDVNGLITGGTYNPTSDRIVLCGYAGITPFIVELGDFPDDRFDEGELKKTALAVPSSFSRQVEAITHFQEDQYFLGAEENNFGNAALFFSSIQTLSDADFGLDPFSIYPNPVGSILNIESGQQAVEGIELYDLLGRQVMTADGQGPYGLNEIGAGFYYLRIHHASGLTSRRVFKQ